MLKGMIVRNAHKNGKEMTPYTRSVTGLWGHGGYRGFMSLLVGSELGPPPGKRTEKTWRLETRVSDSPSEDEAAPERGYQLASFTGEEDAFMHGCGSALKGPRTFPSVKC